MELEWSDKQLEELQNFLEFRDAILNHPNDNIDELLEVARQHSPHWNEEDDEWTKEYAEYLKNKE